MNASPPPVADDRSEPARIDTTIDETEQWFIQQGFPHFIADYTAAERIFPRVIPVLIISFLVTVISTMNEEWPPLWHVGATLATFLILVGLWAVANRARGLPALRLPERVGPVEIGLFLFGPALLNVVAGDLRAAVLLILVNAVLFTVLYYVTSYGFVPMTIGYLNHLFEHVGLALRLVGRTFPVLFLAVTFLLFNGSAWKSMNTMPLARYLTVLGLFVFTTLLFLYRDVATELETVSRLDSPDEIRDLCADTPVGQIASTIELDPSEIPPLGRKERLNVFLLATYGALVYVVVITFFMLTFFVLFGLLTIPDEVVVDLLDSRPEPIFTVRLLEAPVTLTRELVRVSGFFAAFSGLYFAVHAVTDQTFRKELDGRIATLVRRALAVRAVYRALENRMEETESG